jgi:hypothetical protein
MSVRYRQRRRDPTLTARPRASTRLLRVVSSHRKDEHGNAALVTVLAMAITLVVFMVAINLIVDEYGKGAIRTAVDEAAQAGSLQGAPGGPIAACQAKASQVMSGLLNGPFGRDIAITCGINANGQLVATANGTLPAWLRLVPTDAVHVIGSAHIETNP